MMMLMDIYTMIYMIFYMMMMMMMMMVVMVMLLMMMVVVVMMLWYACVNLMESDQVGSNVSAWIFRDSPAQQKNDCVRKPCYASMGCLFLLRASAHHKVDKFDVSSKA